MKHDEWNSQCSREALERSISKIRKAHGEKYYKVDMDGEPRPKQSEVIVQKYAEMRSASQVEVKRKNATFINRMNDGRNSANLIDRVGGIHAWQAPSDIEEVPSSAHEHEGETSFPKSKKKNF